MAPRRKKKSRVRKAKKRKAHREGRRQRRAAVQSQTAIASEPELLAEPLPEPAAEAAESDSSHLDLWWEQFQDADGPEQLQMVRDRLQAAEQDEQWREAIDEAIRSLVEVLPEADYVAFLEELRSSYPGLFAANAHWYVRSMAFFYVSKGCWQEVDDVVRSLADGLDEVDEPFFSIMSLIRLAGRAEAAQVLIEKAISPQKHGHLMPWAVDELIDWAMFSGYQVCVQAGATEVAIEALHQYSFTVGCDDCKEVREHQREFVLHLAGRAAPWRRNQLVGRSRQTPRRFYLLAVDFMRWLCTAQEFEPVVADELRRILIQTIDQMECRPPSLLGGLRRSDFEPALARKLDFLSLDVAHAPAATLAMDYFYDFLADSGLVDARTQARARSLCQTLWREIRQVLRREWHHYKFLEAYLPGRKGDSHQVWRR